MTTHQWIILIVLFLIQAVPFIIDIIKHNNSNYNDQNKQGFAVRLFVLTVSFLIFGLIAYSNNEYSEKIKNIENKTIKESNYKVEYISVKGDTLYSKIKKP